MRLLILLLFSITAQAGIIVLPSPAPSDYPTQTLNFVQSSSTNLYTQLTRAMGIFFKMAWQDPNPTHSPGAFFGALGTNCAQAHELFLGESAILNAAKPSSVPSEPGTVTENSDGTCTVVMPSPSPSPSPS
jgi:hypothetical protein